jgi:hypothetical protein
LKIPKGQSESIYRRRTRQHNGQKKKRKNKLGGAHLKKMRRAEGGANIFGVFRVKNHDFTPKNHIFPFLDGICFFFSGNNSVQDYFIICFLGSLSF